MRRENGTYDSFMKSAYKKGWKKQRVSGTASVLFPRNFALRTLFTQKAKGVLRVNNEKDYAFMMYADICIRNPDNPYLQNIYDHWLLEDGTHVTHCEKLQPAQYNDQGNPEFDKKIRGLWSFLHGTKCSKAIDQKHLADDDLTDALRLFYTTIDRYAGSDQAIIANLDTHEDNIMIRRTQGEDQLVLIDPLRTGTGTEPEYNSITKYMDAYDIILRHKLGLLDQPYMNGLHITRH